MKSVDLAAVLSLFIGLFGRRSVKQWQRSLRNSPAPVGQPAPQRFYHRIFSLSVTLWYLIFQRLNADKSMAAVIKDLRRGGADRLSPSAAQPLSRKVRSHQTSSYSDARQRLPLAFLQWALQRVGEYLGNRSPSTAQAGPSRVFQLIDGSTLPMLGNRLLRQAYPPASNQKGQSDWCLMRVVVGFCAFTGVVLSAIEGSTFLAEPVLAWALMETATRATVWIGDRGFGIWSVAAKAFFHQQDVLLRLTHQRAARLAKGQSWVSGQDREVQWSAGRRDRIAPGTQGLVVKGRLIFIRLRKEGKFIDLWLFTTLLDREAFPVERLVALYGLRWQAELNFRHLKTSLEMEQLFVNSPEMARKEFYAGLLAYSLVRAVMAATHHAQPDLPPLSFEQVRRLLVQWLIDWGRDWRSRHGAILPRLQTLIDQAAHQTLPKRKRKRPSEPRVVRHRRQKFPPFRGSREAARMKAFFETTTKS